MPAVQQTIEQVKRIDVDQYKYGFETKIESVKAPVVELIALDGAEIKYSTVQNWYPGDKNGKGGIYNFVTKRGDCRGWVGGWASVLNRQ
jgi:Fe-S cluster assembly scaffold protein SufB